MCRLSSSPLTHGGPDKGRRPKSLRDNSKLLIIGVIYIVYVSMCILCLGEGLVLHTSASLCRLGRAAKICLVAWENIDKEITLLISLLYRANSLELSIRLKQDPLETRLLSIHTAKAGPSQTRLLSILFQEHRERPGF
jgi:hypothetical protein